MAKAVVAWLATKNSPHTIKAYRCTVTSLMAFINGSARELQWVDNVQAVGFKLWLMKRGCCSNSIRSKLFAMKDLYSYLLSNGIIPGPLNPFSKRSVGIPSTMDIISQTPALSSEEVRLMFEYEDRSSKKTARDRALLALLFYGGMRVSEACGVRMEDCYLSGDTPYVIIRCQKGGGEARQSIAREGVGWLENWMFARHSESDPFTDKKTGPLLTPATKNPKPEAKGMSVASARNRVKRIARAQGITTPVTSHSGRVTAITLLIDAGYTPVEVQKFSRHADIGTVMGYYRDRRGLEGNVGYDISYK
jgi:integrase/recombinase XerD